ncbi:MAG: DsbA family oxidoreductase [Polyangiales bacterium]
MPVPFDRRAMLSLLGASALAACRSAEPDAPPPLPPPAPRPRRVEVWHDTVCPWCRIGVHNLEIAVDLWRGPSFEVVFRPYLLEPDAPPEGADLREHLGRKYGAARVPAMFEDVSRAGAGYGVRFDWNRVRRAPNTVGSHALLAEASDLRRRPLIDALHRAYFEEGADIGDPEKLVSIATTAGLDAAAARRAVTNEAARATVRREAAAARARGIRAVPHFVIGDRTLTGARPHEDFFAAMHAARQG